MNRANKWFVDVHPLAAQVFDCQQYSLPATQVGEVPYPLPSLLAAPVPSPYKAQIDQYDMPNQGVTWAGSPNGAFEKGQFVQVFSQSNGGWTPASVTAVGLDGSLTVTYNGLAKDIPADQISALLRR